MAGSKASTTRECSAPTYGGGNREGKSVKQTLRCLGRQTIYRAVQIRMFGLGKMNGGELWLFWGEGVTNRFCLC